MNNYYVERWKQVRNIEGASQRIQEDTMRFAAIMEGLGVAFVDSIMTLIAFLPVLAALSVHVETLPILGAIPYPLVFLSIVLPKEYQTRINTPLHRANDEKNNLGCGKND